MNIAFISGCFASLFSLINPLSALPVFISLTRNHERKWKSYQIRKTCIYIVLICSVSYFIGTYILNFFGISILALKIAGGIIISRSGFQMLNAQHKEGSINQAIKDESLHKEDISFSPLAMPLLAGPGTISLLIKLSLENSGLEKNMMIILCILLVAFSIYLIFSVAPRILSYTGQAGLDSMSKIMGFLVLSIGIQMITSSVLVLLKPVL